MGDKKYNERSQYFRCIPFCNSLWRSLPHLNVVRLIPFIKNKIKEKKHKLQQLIPNSLTSKSFNFFTISSRDLKVKSNAFFAASLALWWKDNQPTSAPNSLVDNSSKSSRSGSESNGPVD